MIDFGTSIPSPTFSTPTFSTPTDNTNLINS